MENDFKESSIIQILEGKAVGKDWDVVLIEAGMSKNGNFYSADVLKAAVKLFEGLKACAYKFGTDFNHLPTDGVGVARASFSENVVGWFENARFEKFKRPDGTTGEGIVANFHVMEGAQWLRDNLKDAFENGKHDILGFSIDAQGEVREGVIDGKTVNIVEKIDKVNSTDVVSEPAAGGTILRLVASVDIDAKKILEMLKSNRPQWMKGFAEAKEGESEKDYLLNILESNLKDARQAFTEMELDSDPYKAVARGVHKINASIELIKKDKFSEGFKGLGEMISNQLPADSKISDLYSFKEEDIQEATALGDFLKKKANDMDISNEALGNAAGISAGTVGQIMSGNIKRPPNRRLAGFARVLKVSVEMLLNLIPSAVRESIDGAFLTEEEKEEMKTNGDEPSNDDPENEMKDKEIKEEQKKLAIREAALLVKECLMDCKLPDNAKERISSLFEGKEEVTKESIEEAIKKEEEYIASFKEGSDGKPKDLGDAHDDNRKANVKVTQEAHEKIAKGWDGLFEGSDVDGIPMFHSMQEAWGTINPGKWGSLQQTAMWIFESIVHSMPRKIMDGAFDPLGDHSGKLQENWNRVISQNLREATTTSSFSVTFGQALYRRLQKEYAQDPRSDWRKVVSSIENLQDATNTFTIIRLGDFEELPTVNESAPYQELASSFQTEVSETITPDKKGGLIKLSWESILADKLNAIRMIPRGLARASNLTINKLVWGIIESNQNIQSNALISAANNNVATAAISYDAVNDLIQLMRDQTDQDTGEKLGLRPSMLLTGTKLEAEAWEIVNSERKGTAAQDSTIASIIKGKHKLELVDTIGLGRTTATDDHFWVMADPKQNETIAVGFLGGRDRPDIFVQDNSTPNAGSMFDADEITFKVRLVVGASPIDWRSISGSLQ